MTFIQIFAEFKFIIIPCIAWVTAQFIKFAIHLFKTRRIDFTKFTGSGGMPSSHTALTVCLATLIGFSEGLRSPLFGLALIFALVVMYDAAGVRRASGKQAKVLNRMLYHQKGDDYHLEEVLKELIGHTPVEVITGAALGILIAYLLMP
ncbi:MAG: divergent PAP2 family protein [Clostridia bacterium]